MLLKSGRAVTRWHCWSVGSEDVSTVADTKAGTIHAGTALPAGRHATHHGQRRNVLRTSHSFHLHLQVRLSSLPAAVVHLYWLGGVMARASDL